MQSYIVSFEHNESPGLTIAEFEIETDWEGDAIEEATELFLSQDRERDISNYTARLREAE